MALTMASTRGGDAPAAVHPARHAIRLGLRHVRGISDAEIASIEAARSQAPFSSFDDFVRRTNVSRPVVENLIHVGALDTLAPQGRRALLWRAEEIWCSSGRGGAVAARRAGGSSGRATAMARDGATPSVDSCEPPAELPGAPAAMLPFDAPTEGVPLVGLREYSLAETVRAELEVLGLDVTRHLLTFYAPECASLGVVPAASLCRRRNGEIVTVAGVKVATQTPAVRSKQRIIFLTIDDPTGPVDVTVFPSAQNRCAFTVFHGYVLAVRGKLRRTGPDGRGISVVARDTWDLQRLATKHRSAGSSDRGANLDDAGLASVAWLFEAAAVREIEREAARRRHPAAASSRSAAAGRGAAGVPALDGDEKAAPIEDHPADLGGLPLDGPDGRPRGLWHASGGSAG